MSINTIKKVSLIWILSVVSAAAAFGQQAISARLLTIDEYGALTSSLALGIYLSSLIGFGSPGMIATLGGEPVQKLKMTMPWAVARCQEKL